MRICEVIMIRTEFENLIVYQLSEQISDYIWEIVKKWNGIQQDTVGIKLVKSADSIGANIAEGTGRGSFADNRRFAKIARGALFQMKHWLRRSYKRSLLSEEEINTLKQSIDELSPKLSAYINSIGTRKDQA